MGTTKRKATIVGVTAGLTLALAGCASSGGSGTGTAGSSKGPIVVGVIAGTTGAYGSTGQAVVNGTKMAVDEINASGGIIGRQVKLLSANDGASATTASLYFKKFVTDGAIAIFGSPDAATTTVALANSMHVPDIGPIDDCGVSIYPNGPSKPPQPWAWCTSLNTFAWGQIFGQYAAKNCPHGLAVLHDPTFYGMGGLAGIQEVYKAPLKVNDAVAEDWSSGATRSLDAEINKVKASGADCVDVWLTPQDQAAFVNEMHNLGVSFTVMGNDETSADNTFARLAGSNANGMISAVLTTAYQPNTQVKTFASNYQKQFGVAATPFAMLSYDAVFILKKAVEAAHSTNANAIRTELNKITDFPGLTGSLTFTPQQHATINAAQLTLVKYNVAKQGWEPVNP